MNQVPEISATTAPSFSETIMHFGEEQPNQETLDEQVHILLDKIKEGEARVSLHNSSHLIYPAVHGTVSTDAVADIAPFLRGEKEVLGDNGFSILLEKYRDQLHTYFNGERLVNQPDQPFDKGYANMALLWYFAFPPRGKDSALEFLHTMTNDSFLRPSYSHRLENRLIDFSHTEGISSVMVHGVNGYDNVHSSLVFCKLFPAKNGTQYTFLGTEVRRIDGEGEYDIALCHKGSDATSFFAATIGGPRIDLNRAIIKYELDSMKSIQENRATLQPFERYLSKSD
ncbi:MAG: hypothetical protein ACMXYE_02360 [Candidatus Woesearchaeota archaeon]